VVKHQASDETQQADYWSGHRQIVALDESGSLHLKTTYSGVMATTTESASAVGRPRIL
jgi:hypothetical protein